MSNEPKKKRYRCVNHPNRIAAVHNEYHGYLCRECMCVANKVPQELIKKRIDKAFYQPGGPGYAGDEE